MTTPPVKVSALLGQFWEPLDIGRLIFAQNIKDWRAVNLMSICYAESGGYECAVRLNPSDINPSLDLGLWQINTRWHPEVPTKSSITAELAVVEAIRIANCSSWGPFRWNQWMSWTTKEGIAGPARTVWLGPCLKHVNILRVEQGLPAL